MLQFHNTSFETKVLCKNVILKCLNSTAVKDVSKLLTLFEKMIWTQFIHSTFTLIYLEVMKILISYQR